MNLSVSSLVRYLKNKLDTDDKLQRINVTGEISNYHRYQSGHLYFTLKDNNAAIDCVMFKSSAASLKFEPKNGDQVIINANTSLYEVSGKLQLYVNRMVLDGLGDLYTKYLELKEKLENEGYFASEHKIDIPFVYPEKVAVLVGDKSAAMSDIKRCFARRWPLCKVDYYPVLVQGNDAPQDIINTLVSVDKIGYEAIILSRGGGSFEDLFCFNDENLVKTIYNMKTFIITGVGHEQDFTLVDFVSDRRASTPTAAVEAITPVYSDVLNQISSMQNSLSSNVSNKINNISVFYDLINEKLLNYNKSLKNISDNVDSTVNHIMNMLLNSITLKKQNVHNSIDKIKLNTEINIQNRSLNLKRFETLLKAYSIDDVLNRGYSIVMQKDRIIKSVKEIKNDIDLDIRFSDGSIKATVKE